MPEQRITAILQKLHELSGFDFLGYRYSMIHRRIQKRMLATKSETLDEYSNYFGNNPEEANDLFQVLTIHVTQFFRDALVFEFLQKNVFPALIKSKEEENNDQIRIWSAGCSFGEEAYSVAMMVDEIINKEDYKVNIFATDIDQRAILKAKEGLYSEESLANMKYSRFKKYVELQGSRFALKKRIKENVHFSFFDLLDKDHLFPSESIYGGFDIVLCRNVLIYFSTDYQIKIFEKIYKSLNRNGYLVLGEAETLVGEFKLKFKRVNECCKIYQKLG